MKKEEKDCLLEQQWHRLEDVPMNPETECMEEDYAVQLGTLTATFAAGTHREEIWHWFDENHSKGVAYLLYGEPIVNDHREREAEDVTIHVCPNGCAAHLVTTAHVAQTWKVDCEGEFIEEISTDEVDHGPDNDNIWTCEKCGEEAQRMKAIKGSLEHGAVYYPKKYNGFKYIGYPLRKVPLLPDEIRWYEED